LPSSCCRSGAVPHRHAAPSITLNLPSCHPSPHIAVVLSVHRHRARAVPRRRGAVATSIAVKEPLRRPLPLLSRSHHAVPRNGGAIVPSIAVEEPSHRTLPSRSCRPCLLLLTTPATRHAPPRPLVPMVVALPLPTPPPYICRRLSLWHRLL
jgi:hypothetical protein